MDSIAHKIEMKLPIAIDEKGRDWVKALLNDMSLEQRIGQLIHVAAWSAKHGNHKNELEALIDKFHIGGLIFFQGNPENQAKLSNHFQAISKVPVLISTDAEWGLGMRLNGVESFPYQMTMGALPSDELVYEMGKAVGKQLKRVGVQLNHAPVIDVNTNPKNPVISFRSFGQDKQEVASKGKAYMKGMYDQQVLACAKHFPGHGDTSQDSHIDLPLLNKSKKALIETEFFPFKALIHEGLGAVMTAHLKVPKIEPDENRAATLSKTIIDGILKKELGFKGLVFTDALDMKAVADYYEKGALEVEALKAGNDVLLFVKDVALAVSEIKLAILKGELSEEDINEKCAKQLAYKYWAGLMDYKPINLEHIVDDVNKFTAALNEKIYAQSMTLLKRESPFPSKEQKILLVSVFAKGDKLEEGSLNHHTLLKSVIGQGELPVFAKNMKEYYPQAAQISIQDSNIGAFDTMMNGFNGYDNILISVHNVKLKAKDNFGFTSELLELLNSILSMKNTHLVFFGNAYALDKIANLDAASSILLAYQENSYTHEYASQIIKGEMNALGKLPVSINEKFTIGNGIIDE